jgi:tetratricopeptide (TPR) repeat protein
MRPSWPGLFAALLAAAGPTSPAHGASALDATPVAAIGGALQRASAETERVADQLDRAELWRRSGEAWAAVGERDAALAAFDRSAATIATLSPEALRDWPGRELVGALATAREFERAEAQAAGIARREARDGAWSDIAIERINTGDGPAARRAAARIRGTVLQDETLRSISAVLASRGEVDAAADAARAITGSRTHNLALGDAAAAEATRGSLEQALATASRIVDSRDRAHAWARVAAARARLGDAAGALRVARGIKDPFEAARALGFAASATATAGASEAPAMFARALGALRDAPAKPEARVEALTEHARLRIAAGDRPGALEALAIALPVARPLGRSDEGHRRLETIARLYVAAGDAPTGRQLWAELAAGGGPLAGPTGMPAPRRGVPRSRDSLLLRDLVEAQVKSGDAEGARRFAASIADPELRAIAALGIAAQLVAAAGGPVAAPAGVAPEAARAEALRAVRAVPSAGMRAPMLAALAVLGDAGGSDGRDALIAEALELAGRFDEPADRAHTLLDVADVLVGR